MWKPELAEPRCQSLRNVLGYCGLFEEVQVGAERFNFFTKCASWPGLRNIEMSKGERDKCSLSLSTAKVKTKTATILIRGGAQQFIDEAERSLNDSLMMLGLSTSCPSCHFKATDYEGATPCY